MADDHSPGSGSVAGPPDGSSAAVLVLYVSPGSALSLRARRNLEAVLAGYDVRSVRLEVRDVKTDALRAEEDRVVFTPTLVVRSGPTPAWVVGDLSDGDTIVNLLRLGGVEPAS